MTLSLANLYDAFPAIASRPFFIDDDINNNIPVPEKDDKWVDDDTYIT
jgi:hypothetical protein